MNKSEIEHKLEQAKRDRQIADDEFTKEIFALQSQLAEAEKPKLEHGDFGLDKSKCPSIAINDQKDKVRAAKPGGTNSEGNPWGLPEIIFGNIFKMMENWSKPFEEWNKDAAASGINIENDDRISMYFCTGADCTKENNRCHFEIEQAKEIWVALGHALMDLKRKQAL